MSSEVETSLTVRERSEEPQITVRDSSTSVGTTVEALDMTKKPFFAKLFVYRDEVPRSAAINMAIDEALLEQAIVPTIRFYRWDHPALSFGYFGKFADVAGYQRDSVRRWTGGGIVLHGDDLTYSLVIPASDSAFKESSMSIYENVHRAISTALMSLGTKTELASEKSGEISESCFASPVRADVLLNGRKIAGAAQRRTHRGLLQQGSIQDVDLPQDFEQRFVHQLSANFTPSESERPVLDRAEMIAEQKYAAAAWLQKR
jgi:lipoate-protein ligase A